MDLTIRTARAGDLPAILRLYAQPAFDGAAISLAEAEALFARIGRYPDYHLYVAEAGGAVAGTFALLIMDNLGHRGSPSGVVEDVAVDEARQGQGIGRRMMAFARERCRAAGCYKMALSSNMRRTEAHAFYEALGFERHGYSFRIDLAPEVDLTPEDPAEA